MRLSERFVSRKAFSEPPFWTRTGNLYSGSLPDRETIGDDFQGYIHEAYKASGVVFATSLARQMLFSEARFAWRPRTKDGRPGLLFSDPNLSLLESPWPSGTTGELLARMIQDADLAGNFFAANVDDEGRMGRAARGNGLRIARMRPDWVTIILGSKTGDANALDARPIAYQFKPPAIGGGSATEPVLLVPSEVCHFSPLPDPAARFRGMSWLTPVIREIMADKAATKHKLKFFDQGATLSTIITLDKDVTPDGFAEFVEQFKAQHEGVDTAYKTLFMGGGADVTLNGANMQQVDFKATQGSGETRIAAAGGMHPVIIGLSEGLAGSSLNQGNFEAAKRLTADKTLRPLWRTAAASLLPLTTGAPAGAVLDYDDRDIPFLRDDTTDVAEIQSKQAVTARQFTDAGYTPASVIEFLETGNLRALEHSGLYSVQLQAPGGPALPIAEEA
jgi:phage portal protein BeeE